MQYASGTVFAYGDLRTAMRTFATRTLGTFEDLFEGELGVSIVSPSTRETIGLRHIATGATYLFDFVDSESHFFGNEGEYTIVGQLLDIFQPDTSPDYESIVSPDTNIGQIIDGPFDASDTTTITLLDGVYTLTDTTATASSSLDGIFQGLKVGHGILVEDNVDSNIIHVLSVETVDSLGEVATAVQVGAYLVSTGLETSATLAVHNPNQDKIRVVRFDVELDQPAVDSSFGNLPSSMWEEEITLSDVQDGYFPRSGRHNFDEGVSYWFYGDTGDEDYFHMVLKCESSGIFTHWWMGRLTGGSPAINTDQGSAGMFLGTSGPYTDSGGLDTYQYPFQFGTATSAALNPSIVVTPMANSNAELQFEDPTVYTGATEYYVNFDEDNLDGWFWTNATLQELPGAVELTSITADPQFDKTGLTIDPSVANTVRFAIRRTTDSGTAGNTGQVFFQTLTDTTYVGNDVSWDATNLHTELDEWWIIDVFMGDHPDWTGTVTDIRIDTPDSVAGGDVYEISWIRVDDGDRSVSDGSILFFEQPFGGAQGYGPTGPTDHDPTFGPSALDFKTLRTGRYSIQAGLAGFNGPLTYGMCNYRDRTWNMMRRSPNQGVTEVGINVSVNTPPALPRFANTHCVLYECPFPSVRDVRQAGAGNEDQENARYMGQLSFFMYLGQFPGVYRGTLIEDAEPRVVDFGSDAIDQFPVSLWPLAPGTLKYPEVPTGSDSGNAAYFYPRS